MKAKKVTVVPAAASVSAKGKGDTATLQYGTRQWIVGVFTDAGFKTGAEFLAEVHAAGKATGKEKWANTYAKEDYAIARASELVDALAGDLADFSAEAKLADKLAGKVEAAKESVAKAEKAKADAAKHAKTDAGRLERLAKTAESVGKGASKTLSTYAATVVKKCNKWKADMEASGCGNLDELLDKLLAERQAAEAAEPVAAAS